MGKSEFAFTVQSTFHKEKFDEAHPCAASLREHPNCVDVLLCPAHSTPSRRRVVHWGSLL
eukprot:763408-Prymnesium_polylepis.1